MRALRSFVIASDIVIPAMVVIPACAGMTALGRNDNIRQDDELLQGAESGARRRLVLLQPVAPGFGLGDFERRGGEQTLHLPAHPVGVCGGVDRHVGPGQALPFFDWAQQLDTVRQAQWQAADAH